MEQLSLTPEQQPSFEERLKVLIDTARTHLEQRPNDTTDNLRNIEMFEKNFPAALNADGTAFLTSLNDSEFEKIIGGTFHYYTGNANRSLETIEPLSVDNLKSMVDYQRVRGYGHPDLERRKEVSPMPTAQELLLGCYIEQIESQTRDAVLTLRRKGYQTTESGFCDEFAGTQFFHLRDAVVVPESLTQGLKEKFGTTVTIDDGHIHFIPTTYTSLEQWKECLDYFAEHMPQIGEETFAPVGGAVGFALHAIETFHMEEVLKTTEDKHERELIQKLYACKNEDEVVELLKINK